MSSQFCFKVSPRYFTWCLRISNSETNVLKTGNLHLSTNFAKNIESIKEILILNEASEYFFENPHVVIDGSRHEIIKNIQFIQRTVGLTICLIWELFEKQPNSLVPLKNKPSKEEMIAKAKEKISNMSNPQLLTDLECLCFFDCFSLLESVNEVKPITAKLVLQDSCNGDCRCQ